MLDDIKRMCPDSADVMRKPLTSLMQWLRSRLEVAETELSDVDDALRYLADWGHLDQDGIVTCDIDWLWEDDR